MWNWNMLRLNQLYDPANVSNTLNNTGGMIPGLNQPIQPAPQDLNNDDATQRLAQLYHPSMNMQNQFNSQISQMPQRQNYQLGKIGQIGAALANLGTGGPAGMWGGNPVGYRSNIPGGINVQSALQDAPYQEAMQDWQKKLVPLQQAADNERLANVNERNFAEQTVTRERQAKEEERKVKRDEQLKAKEDAAQATKEKDAETRRMRAQKYSEVQDFKMKHPEMATVVDKDGKVWMYDKINKEAIDTGLEKLSDMEKINLGVQGRLEEIEAQNQGRINAKQTPPAKSPNVSQPKPQSEASKLQGAKNRIMIAVNAHPELRNYFEYDSGGKPTGMMAKHGMFDDPELTKQAVQIANGTADTTSTEAKIKVRRKADGKTGTLDAKDFDANKYERIQ